MPTNVYAPAPGTKSFGANASAVSSPTPSVVGIFITLLLSAVLVSSIYQLARYPNQPALWSACWHQPIFGFGDPLYFLTSAFIWIQGLGFLRLATAEGMSPAAWLWPVFFCHAACLLFFAALQWGWQFPNAYESFALTGPYEDIHSFGAIAIGCFIFLLVGWSPHPTATALASLLGLASLLALVIGSWSRATWLAGLAGIVQISFLRTKWRGRAALAFAALGLIVAAHKAAETHVWQNNLYLSRFGNLVRFENPRAKDPTRIYLYLKAGAMIREHPLIGHGIGAFYAKSVYYAQPGDPDPKSRNFAHNFALQFAAEMGLPMTLSLLALIGAALRNGYRAKGEAAIWARPLTITLTCYLVTQLTANALNIYISNQFFFWTLIAALLSEDVDGDNVNDGVRDTRRT